MSAEEPRIWCAAAPATPCRPSSGPHSVRPGTTLTQSAAYSRCSNLVLPWLPQPLPQQLPPLRLRLLLRCRGAQSDGLCGHPRRLHTPQAECACGTRGWVRVAGGCHNDTPTGAWRLQTRMDRYRDCSGRHTTPAAVPAGAAEVKRREGVTSTPTYPVPGVCCHPSARGPCRSGAAWWRECLSVPPAPT